jgi:serine/threonine protein kinase
MHGIVFFLLHRFAENVLGADGWPRLLAEAGLKGRRYSPAVPHADEDLVAMVEAASRLTGKTAGEVLELFGEYLGPELLDLHPRLIQPQWKTLDVVANTEEVIHRVVRVNNPGAHPPQLRARRISADEVHLVYSSPRQMCALARGMVKGLAEHFHETIDIKEDACMLRGDPFCSFVFHRTEGEAAVHDSGLLESDTRLNLVHSDTRPISAVTPTPLPAEGSGEREPWIGTYRVQRLLGKGGMGQVYLAEDPALQRQVAIKLMREDLAANDMMRERFVQEARSMAALEHEHIVPIYHIGHHQHSPYIVMPRLKGVDLGRWLRGGHKITPMQLLRIVKQTASALAVAHEAKLIHRDVKPSNIWLEAPHGHVKLMDFGLCRSLDEIVKLTVPGVVVGTPMYVAPECVEGEADERSDLYSLGVVMYEALTGVQPFAGPTLTATVAKIANKVPDPPRASNLEIPPALDDLVMQLLEKEAAKRPATAQELGEQIRQISNDLRFSSGVAAKP